MTTDGFEPPTSPGIQDRSNRLSYVANAMFIPELFMTLMLPSDNNDVGALPIELRFMYIKLQTYTLLSSRIELESSDVEVEGFEPP